MGFDLLTAFKKEERRADLGACRQWGASADTPLLNLLPKHPVSRTRENWKDWSGFPLPTPFLSSGAPTSVNRETLLLTFQRGQETSSAQ